MTDELFLWILIDPAKPVLVGDLRAARSPRGVSVHYTDEWLDQGFALSEDLPLIDEEFLPKEKDTAAGAVDDARPDRWGERVIRFLDKPPRLSLLEYLYFAGDDRFGALGVSTSRSAYLPRRLGPLPTLRDTDRVHDLVRRILSNEPIPPEHRRLISPGVTMGGARPKALLDIDGEQWVVKFAAGDPIDAPLVEHASMTLAMKAGIVSAPTIPIRLVDGHAVAVKRFDRGKGRRLHAVSANVVLKAAGETLGYPELAQLLRRRGTIDGGLFRAQMRELFRRMVFNILIDNTDDHEKNHVVLVSGAQEYELSPAFDVLPSGQALGYQQMRVGRDECDSTLDNAMSMHSSFSLEEGEAVEAIRNVIEVVDGWKQHFAECGVASGDIDALSEQIDRDFLKAQREGF